MQKSIFDIIGSITIFSIWLTIAIIAIRQYRHLMKIPGVNSWKTNKDIDPVSEEDIANAKAKWKKLTLRLFTIWVITVFAYMIIAAIIDNTIGFK